MGDVTLSEKQLLYLVTSHDIYQTPWLWGWKQLPLTILEHMHLTCSITPQGSTQSFCVILYKTSIPAGRVPTSKNCDSCVPKISSEYFTITGN